MPRPRLVDSPEWCCGLAPDADDVNEDGRRVYDLFFLGGISEDTDEASSSSGSSTGVSSLIVAARNAAAALADLRTTRPRLVGDDSEEEEDARTWVVGDMV